MSDPNSIAGRVQELFTEYADWLYEHDPDFDLRDGTDVSGLSHDQLTQRMGLRLSLWPWPLKW